MKKLFKGLFAAGFAAGLTLLVRKLLARETVDIQLQTSTQEIQSLKKQYLESIHQHRSEAVSGAGDASRRQIVAALYDQMEESAQLLDTVRPSASVLYNGLTRSRLERILDAVFGPLVSFLLSLLALGALIAAKWTMETELTAQALAGLNTALACSGAAALHLLVRLILAGQKAAGDRSRIRIGVEMTADRQGRELFIENRCESAARSAEQVSRLLELAEAPCSSDLTMMADIYCQMFQAKAMEDYADVDGYLLPRCRQALKGMGVEIVAEYTLDTSHLFDITEAPGYGRSCVIRPALVMKDSGEVLSRGEYVHGL